MKHHVFTVNGVLRKTFALLEHFRGMNKRALRLLTMLPAKAAGRANCYAPRNALKFTPWIAEL